MKSTNEFYEEIRIVLKSESPILEEEFNIKTVKNSPKEVFLWLDSIQKEGKLPNNKNLEDLLTDFFFSIH
ncbi:MAG: hypothetical protein SFU25_08610 [Candidatus Caenarcaniphilales bacterium]|nr:hypothetical protein [Candidatus Caenarcaniphilales bacterium]